MALFATHLNVKGTFRAESSNAAVFISVGLADFIS
jgi:hypothetical protein